jgi:protein-S-isoprenylcysteine O-methyltransferase Ste14
MKQIVLSKITSVAVFFLAVVGLIYLIFQHYLFAGHPVGIAVQVLSAALMIWARITFGTRSFHAVANTTEGRLVTNGPYRWLRHPIYAAVIYFVWAGVLCHPVIEAVAAAVLISMSLIARMLIEEKFLREAYIEYSEYSKHTSRLIPLLF